MPMTIRNKSTKFKVQPFTLPKTQYHAGMVFSGEDYHNKVHRLADLFVKGGAKVGLITNSSLFHLASSTYHIPYSDLAAMYQYALSPYIRLSKTDSELINLTSLVFGHLVYPDLPIPDHERTLLSSGILLAFENKGPFLKGTDIIDLLRTIPGGTVLSEKLSVFFPRVNYFFGYNKFTIRPHKNTFELRDFQFVPPSIRGYAVLLVLFQFLVNIKLSPSKRTPVIIIDHLWTDLVNGAGREFLILMSNTLRQMGGFLILTTPDASVFNLPDVVSLYSSVIDKVFCFRVLPYDLIELCTETRQKAKERYIKKTQPEAAELVGEEISCFDCRVRPLTQFYESESLGVPLCQACYDLKKRVSLVSETVSAEMGVGFERITPSRETFSPVEQAKKLLTKYRGYRKSPRLSKEFYLYLKRRGEIVKEVAAVCFHCQKKQSGTFYRLKSRHQFLFCQDCVLKKVIEMNDRFNSYRSQVNDLFGFFWLLTHQRLITERKKISLNFGLIPLPGEKENQIQEIALTANRSVVISLSPATLKQYPMMENYVHFVSMGPGELNPFYRLDYIDSSRLIALTAIIGQMVCPDRPLTDEETQRVASALWTVSRKHQRKTTFLLIAEALLAQNSALAQSIGRTLKDFVSADSRKPLFEGKRAYHPPRRITFYSLELLSLDPSIQVTAFLLLLFEILADRPEDPEAFPSEETELIILDGTVPLLKKVASPDLMGMFFRNAKDWNHSIIQIIDTPELIDNLSPAIRREMDGTIGSDTKSKITLQCKELLFSQYLDHKFQERGIDTFNLILGTFMKEERDGYTSDDLILYENIETDWEIRQFELIALAIREYHSENSLCEGTQVV